MFPDISSRPFKNAALFQAMSILMGLGVVALITGENQTEKYSLMMWLTLLSVGAQMLAVLCVFVGTTHPSIKRGNWPRPP